VSETIDDLSIAFDLRAAGGRLRRETEGVETAIDLRCRRRKSAGGWRRFPVAQTNPPMAGGFGAVVALSPNGADGSDVEEPVGPTTAAVRPSTEPPLAATTRGQGGRACAAGNPGSEGPAPDALIRPGDGVEGAVGLLRGARALARQGRSIYPRRAIAGSAEGAAALENITRPSV
jgi:hypothetical protein